MKRFAFLIAVFACSPEPPPKPPVVTTPADEILFDVPAGWVKEQPASNMRKAQYRVPDKQKKAGDAQLVVFYFGPSPQPLDENLGRWAAQMGSVGVEPESIQGKLKVTMADLKGTYTGDLGGQPVAGARMLAAIVEHADGDWIFKLIGPAETVGGWREEFIALLKSARK